MCSPRRLDRGWQSRFGANLKKSVRLRAARVTAQKPGFELSFVRSFIDIGGEDPRSPPRPRRAAPCPDYQSRDYNRERTTGESERETKRTNERARENGAGPSVESRKFLMALVQLRLIDISIRAFYRVSEAPATIKHQQQRQQRRHRERPQLQTLPDDRPTTVALYRLTK